MHDNTPGQIDTVESQPLTRGSLVFYGLNILIAGIAIGGLIATGTMGESKPAQIGTPDYTIARCNLWAGETSPVLPPYTASNVCITDDNTISVAP